MRHLYLIGYRGSGKTSVARELSKRVGQDWVDTDQLVEQSAGQSIKNIFAEKGEPEFRKLETLSILELSRGAEPMIISLGGGAILSAQNRDILKIGHVVWLKASAATLAVRVSGDSTSPDRRPRLTDSHDLLQEIERVLAVRTPIYESCANYVVDTERRSLDEICGEIMLWLQKSTTIERDKQTNYTRTNVDEK
jgi:shikimate kinase